MTANDSERVAALSGELGYPSTAAQIAARFAAIQGHPEARVFVATDRSDTVRGWVHVYGHRQVESEGAAEIGGLVVEDAFRGQGIGRLLVDAAESWARQRGYSRLTLRSSVVRTEAHQFYERLGFTILKSQYRFQKPIR